MTGDLARAVDSVVRSRAVWTPDGLREGATIELDVHGRIIGVRPGRAGDGPTFDGLVLPGLINAHTHLELSGRAGMVGPGGGFVGWASRLMALPPAVDEGACRAAVRALQEAGTAWVWDVSNRGDTGALLAEAGLGGVVQHELLGFDRERVAALVEAARGGVRRVDGVLVRPVPHALFSTAPELVRAAVLASAEPCSLHVAESGDEAAFLRDGTGPFAELLDRLGRDWRWWKPPGTSAVQYLDALGVLGPGLVLVHGIWLDEADLALVARRGATVCLCPRSNLHVEGRLPDLRAMGRAGVRLCLGTDSLASSPDLDVLAEIPVLGAVFPEVPVERWLAACTHEAAAALGLRSLGRIEAGASPGLVALAGVRGLSELLQRPPPHRAWWTSPGGEPCAHS